YNKGLVFSGCERPDGKRMDIALHQVIECRVYQAVALNRIQAVKARRNHREREMSALGRTGMAGVGGRFIGNLNTFGIELSAQALLDGCGTCAHGSTLRNGRTATSANTPAATYG